MLVLSLVGAGSTDVSWVLAGTCRTLGYVGLVLLLGMAMFTSWVWPVARGLTRARHLAGGGAVLLAVTTVLTPYAVAGGAGLDSVTGRQVALCAIRLAIALTAVVVLFAVPGAMRSLRRVRLATTFGGSTLILTYVLLSDAWGGPLATIKIVATFLHVGATAAWLGGLAALLLVVLPLRGVRGMSELFDVFSPMAATCVAILVVSGSVHALIVVAEGGVDDVGRFLIALLVKSGIVGLMLLLGNIGRLHHRRLRRHQVMSQHSDGVLAAGIGAELACGVVVLVATAVLVSLA